MDGETEWESISREAGGEKVFTKTSGWVRLGEDEGEEGDTGGERAESRDAAEKRGLAEMGR